MNGIKYGPGTDGGRRSFLKFTGLATATALAGMDSAQAAANKPAVTVEDVSKLPRVKQVMVDPPFLPEHEQTAPSGPRIIEVTLPVIEKKMADRRRRH